MKSVHPYLIFDGNAEEAFNFYQSVFGGELVGMVRFSDLSEDDMGARGDDRNKVANVCFQPISDGKATIARTWR